MPGSTFMSLQNMPWSNESSLDAIVKEMESSLKEGFERNLVAAFHNGYTTNRIFLPHESIPL